jgi:ABC-type thiamin/hydroxymethylpyrimidine transport system permease subunit
MTILNGNQMNISNISYLLINNGLVCECTYLFKQHSKRSIADSDNESFCVGKKLIMVDIIIIALQTFVGPWPLFKLFDPIHSQ